MKHTPRWKHWAYFALGWMALFGLWIAFSFSVGRDELIVGAVCALVAGGFEIFVILREPTPFRPSIALLLQAWRLPGDILRDARTIALASLRAAMGQRTRSLYRAIPFNAGAPLGKRDTARRVLAITYTTVTPNSIAIGIDARRGLLLIHQIERSAISRMLRNLGALQ